MPKTKWTQKELKEIWAKGIKCFPEPTKKGIRYGVSDDFMPVCINNWESRLKFSQDESFEEIQSEKIHAKSHLHRFSGDCLWGGTGSGKSQTTVGIGMTYAFCYPGSRGLVGGKVYGDLKANVIDLYKQLLTIKSPWDHPAVKSYPSMTSSHNKTLVLEPYPGANWSEIEFFQMDEWERVRGRNRDWMHLEEISQFDDDSIIDEAPRRLRSMKLPVSHLICTTNPPETTSHWIYNKWNVYQYLPSWGDKPKTAIGNPCKCQLCQACLDVEIGEFPYDNNGICTNPKCAFIKISGQRGQRDYYQVNDNAGNWHTVYCPGNENYWRIIFSDASSNPHKRADYLQTIVGSSDEKIGQLYAKGRPIELNSNNAYRTFSYENIREDNKPLDPDKDIHWGFDFNTRPQCSVICQEELDSKGELDFITQIDEIILFDIREVKEGSRDKDSGAGPEHVAAQFMERYPKFSKTVYLWGDPSAVNKSTSPLEKTKYQIINDILVQAGYKVQMMVKKVKGEVRQIPLIDRINNANWIFRDNRNKIRFYINPKCEYTITSLRDIKIDKSGEKLDKKNVDEYARRTTKVIYPEDVYKRVVLVSHPGDAITYYLYQRFPLIKNVAHTFFSIPGEGSFKLDGNKIIETKSNIKEQEKKEATDGMLIEVPQQSFLDLFSDLGATFGEEYKEDENIFSSFFQ